MSIRVNNQEVGLNTQSIAADQTRVSGSARAKAAGQANGEDHYSFSATSDHVSAALSSGSAGRAERIRSLSALVASGNYNVSSHDLSRSILASAAQVAG